MRAVTFDLMQKLRKRSLTKSNAGCASTGFLLVKLMMNFIKEVKRWREAYGVECANLLILQL